MTQWQTAAWVGSGNNAVFNAVDFGLSTSDPTNGVNNAAALFNALTAAAKGDGGIVYIPAGSYPISGTITLSTQSTPAFPDRGLIIAGAGGGTELVQQNLSADMFSFYGFNSGKGVRFKDLRLSYPATKTTPPTIPAAIRVVYDCQDITCERVYFENCPQALYLGNRANQCGLMDCTIDYDSLDGQVMVYITGSEDFIHNCVIRQPSQNTVGSPPPDGPKGCTGIVIASASSTYITDSHISDFYDWHRHPGRWKREPSAHLHLQRPLRVLDAWDQNETAREYWSHPTGMVR